MEVWEEPESGSNVARVSAEHMVWDFYGSNRPMAPKDSGVSLSLKRIWTGPDWLALLWEIRWGDFLRLSESSWCWDEDLD